MRQSRTAIVVVAILWARLSNSLSVFSTQTNHLLILGLGRVGREVARLGRDAGKFERITGTVRHVKDDATAADGIQRIQFEHADEIRRIARRCSHVLITIPPSKNDEESIETDELFQSVVEELPACGWIGILSTTGVYGNHNGAWVSEGTACKPASSSTARQYLAYEDAWKKRAARHSLRIFRCAGIYSPDQSALHTVFKNGLPRRKDETSVSDASSSGAVTNRIYVEDLATGILSSMQLHSNGDNSGCRIYNLADDLPESRTVVMSYAAQLLRSIGVFITEAPPTIEGSRAQRRRTDQKRVSNRKMRQELLEMLKFPTYKEGFSEILQDRRNPWW
jgi:hypothetical protein